MAENGFPACPVCGTQAWTPVYQGPVRDGVFGRLSGDTTVARCGGCGVDRLDENDCIGDAAYQSEAYRAKLEQELDSESYFAIHDELQIYTLQQLQASLLRGATVVDVGCAGGSFLDHISGVAGKLIAIEPSEIYRSSLSERGYSVFAYAADAHQTLAASVDLAVSIQVIEHVADPRAFLEDIRPLLRDDGTLLISTPNRRDILLDLLPDDYPAFFHRVVHRWYFDEDSLRTCAEQAGYEVADVRHVHRFGLSNVLAWMRDRRPTGRVRLEGIDRRMDQGWKSQLEATGRGDCIYMTLRPRKDGADEC